MVPNSCILLLTCQYVSCYGYFFPCMFCAFFFLLEENLLFPQDAGGNGLLKGRRRICEGTAERVLEERKKETREDHRWGKSWGNCRCYCPKASFGNRSCHGGVFFGGIWEMPAALRKGPDG
ncbi:hypothetical protein VIN7_5731 [Saccharomyces cerevisiae x Saccharomyces kudriavzevii VIN7]|uniref:Uncharacterized protein n=1 Tax=Saccharomyces cerevisiae x Saccharomyces kudriavzevii (strain VIN7) TaxID=1095631 RepID=H0GRK4_SACCK|nr:hypothetical protein VIN7_5731 [Saccharomyces cerevisiae x Saccharomyces kudriavzevii VIN7]